MFKARQWTEFKDLLAFSGELQLLLLGRRPGWLLKGPGFDALAAKCERLPEGREVWQAFFQSKKEWGVQK